jgi:hypothetical protein
MAYTLNDVMTAILTGIQDTLYYIFKTVADNAETVATVVVVGILGYGIVKFGSGILRGVTGFVKGLF